MDFDYVSYDILHLGEIIILRVHRSRCLAQFTVYDIHLLSAQRTIRREKTFWGGITGIKPGLRAPPSLSCGDVLEREQRKQGDRFQGGIF